IAFPRTVFGLFTRDAAVLEFAPAFMLIGALIFLLSAVMGPYEAVITGTGNAGLSLLGGLLDGVIFRISFSFFFARACGMGVQGFFLGDALARLGPILVGGIYYYSGAWKKRKKLLS
ncbi:MAG: MATE family efflux transporter, partial [Clostridia bacterium]|nr:MATE family efflux transporter [Clostridia bacterium]